MLAYGYEKAEEDAESPMQLREVTLQVTLDEIDTIVAFLQDTKQKFARGKPLSGHAHAHFRYWLAGWTPAIADLVTVYEDDK